MPIGARGAIQYWLVRALPARRSIVRLRDRKESVSAVNRRVLYPIFTAIQFSKPQAPASRRSRRSLPIEKGDQNAHLSAGQESAPTLSGGLPYAPLSIFK